MSTRSPSEKVPYSMVSFTGQSMHDKVIAVRTGPGQGADDCKGEFVRATKLSFAPSWDGHVTPHVC